MTARRRTLLRLAVLLGLPVVLFWPVLGAGFVWDDGVLIGQNATLGDPSALGLIWAGARGFHDYYPLTWTLFWAELQAWGPAPAPFHAVHLALHLLSVVLLWRLLESLRLPGAWSAALLFAIHPLNVATVAWVSETKNTLSFVFYAVSALAWIRWMRGGGSAGGPAPARGAGERPGRAGTSGSASGDAPRPMPAGGDLPATPSPAAWWIALAALGAGLLCKASGVVLPLAFLAGLRCSGRLREWRAWLPFVLVSALAAIGAVVTQWSRAIGGMPLPPEGIGERLAAAGSNLAFYVSRSLFPVGLTCVYPRAPVAVGSLEGWLPLLGVGCLGALLVSGARRDRRLLPLAWGAGWFMLALSPVLGFVPMSFHAFARVADFWVYLALPGLLAGMVASGSMLLGRSWGGVVVAAAVLGFSGLTAVRVGDWHDGLALWSRNVRVQPASWCGHNSLGFELENLGRDAEAMEEYRAALAARPDYPLAQGNLARLLRRLGRVDEALALHREVWRRHPGDAEAANELAWILATTRRDDLRRPREALVLAEAACRATSGPPDPTLLDTRAAALAADGRPREATRVAEEALGLAEERRQDGLASQIRQHLEAFREGRPWLED